MKLMLGLAVTILAALVGCSPTSAPPTATPLPPATPTPMIEATPDATAEVADLPAWQTMTLINVRTGETFTLADFVGKTVLVHPFAVWCTNCRSDHRKLRDDVIPTLDADKFVFVSLNIEANEPDDSVAGYADDEKFDWTFATVPTAMLDALIEQFGNSVNVPPIRPRFYLRPDGTVTELQTGEATAADYLNILNQVSAGNA